MREKIDYTEEDGERSVEEEHVNSVLAEGGGGGGAGEAWPRDPSGGGGGGVRPIPGPKGDRGLRGRASNEPIRSLKCTITEKAFPLLVASRGLPRDCEIFADVRFQPYCLLQVPPA